MKRILYLFIAIFFSVTLPSFADVNHIDTIGGENADRSHHWEVNTDGDIVPGNDGNVDIGTSALRVGTIYADDISRSTDTTIVLPVSVFTLNTSGNLTTTTQPGLESDNSLTSVVWADGETTPIHTTFRVPDDYTSGGNFRIVASQSSADAGNCQIGWGFYLNQDGETWDTSRWDGSFITVTGTATPDYIVLTESTAFSSIAAGDLITIEFWRTDDVAGTGDLEIYYAEFYYDS